VQQTDCTVSCVFLFTAKIATVSKKKPSESRDILIPVRQTDGRQDSVAEMAALVALGSAGSSMYRINAAHLMLDASPTKFGMRRVPITDQWTEPDLDVFPLENPPPRLPQLKPGVS